MICNQTINVDLNEEDIKEAIKYYLSLPAFSLLPRDKTLPLESIRLIVCSRDQNIHAKISHTF